MNIFNKLYPPPQGGYFELTTSLLFGLFIAVFLLFFEPFDINVINYQNKVLKIAFFGIITFGVLILFLVIFPKVLPVLFKDNNWKVKHHIFYNFIILFFIATLNGLYINYINQLQFNWSNYWWIITRTYALGAIPISIIILFDHNRRLNINLKKASELNSVQPNLEARQKVLLTLEKRHKLILDDQTFLYIQSEGNYIQLFQFKEEQVDKMLFRASLNEVMSQIDLPFIQRCHRSYIVNLKSVSHVSGNAQGLKLELHKTGQVIPVSRSYISQIEAYFQNPK